MNTRSIAAVAAFSAMIAILTGAFAAHGIQQPQTAEWVKTAAYYQLLHSVALLLLAATSVPGAVLSLSQGSRRWVMIFLLAGILLFSGSLYLLAATGVRMLGMITPIGGVSLVLAWGVWGAGLCRRAECNISK